MKVKIISSSTDTKWYAKHIGDMFEINSSYRVIGKDVLLLLAAEDEPDVSGYYIEEQDCEEVKGMNIGDRVRILVTRGLGSIYKDETEATLLKLGDVYKSSVITMYDGAHQFIATNQIEAMPNTPEFTIGDHVHILNTSSLDDKYASATEAIIVDTVGYCDFKPNVLIRMDDGAVQSIPKIHITASILTKQAALKLCIDGANVTNEILGANSYILFDGIDFKRRVGTTIIMDVNEAMQGKEWKIWTPLPAKFSIGDFAIAKDDGDYVRIINQRHEAGEWKYDVAYNADSDSALLMYAESGLA